MREYGLIGYPLEHSFSRKYFTKKFEEEALSDIKYHLFPITRIDKIKNVLEAHQNLHGLNVTTPYKESVIPFLDDLDTVALNIGAVNTVLIQKNSSGTVLKGYNTDVFGLEKLYELFDLPSKALIIGSGGVSRAVRYTLKKRGLSGLTVTRQPNSADHLGYDEINRQIIQQHKLIVNCTPIGMFPIENQCPAIPYEYLTPKHICIDLIYNPEKTLFLQKAEEKGAKIINGHEMLLEQAEQAWKIWQEAWEKRHRKLKV